MRKMGFIITLIIGLFIINQNAIAGLDLEPYAGYEMNKSTIDIVSLAGGSSLDDTNNGIGFGMRLGYSFLVASVGVDYYTSKLKATAFDLTVAEYGLYAGLSLGFIRAWAVYLVNSKVDTELSSTNFEFKGNALKVGVGFSPIPLVPLSINLDVIARNMTEVNGSSLPSGSEVKFASYMISVSAPI